MKKNLCEHTKELLINRPRPTTLTIISDATGISVSWLNQFAAGKIENPSVNTIQALFEFLTGKALKL